MKKLLQGCRYFFLLLLGVMLFWSITFNFYMNVADPFFIYVGNVFVILGVLAWDKFEENIWEQLFKRLKKK